jgi:MYXO-CTERM domain-containing protein
MPLSAFVADEDVATACSFPPAMTTTGVAPIVAAVADEPDAGTGGEHGRGSGCTASPGRHDGRWIVLAAFGAVIATLRRRRVR